MELTEQIAVLRMQIDAVDRQLIALLASRFQLCLRVGHLKEQAHMPVMQPGRVADVAQRAASEASRLGVSPEFAEALWHKIILEACRLEDLRKSEHSDPMS